MIDQSESVAYFSNVITPDGVSPQKKNAIPSRGHEPNEMGEDFVVRHEYDYCVTDLGNYKGQLLKDSHVLNLSIFNIANNHI